MTGMSRLKTSKTVMNDTPAPLGAWLRQLRKARKLPLRTVAAAVEMDSTLLSKVELGQRRPTEKQTRELAAFFGLPPEKMEAQRLTECFWADNADNPAAKNAALLIQEHAAIYSTTTPPARNMPYGYYAPAVNSTSLLAQMETLRKAATQALDSKLRGALGQFLTPLPTAQFMASLFSKANEDLHLLDAGAASGMLSAATVMEQLAQPTPPRSITLTALELDAQLIPYLQKTYALCATACRARDVNFASSILQQDFISYATDILRSDMFAPLRPKFNAAIVNPPYTKIGATSLTRQQLSAAGIETSNLYTAFLALLARLLDEGGELVAITPRSFCSGPYFKPFRSAFFKQMALRQIHLFSSRSQIFQTDGVLQENIILSAVKSQTRPQQVVISTDDETQADKVTQRIAPYDELLEPKDKDHVVHLTTNNEQAEFRRLINQLSTTLPDLGLDVSTGRVVDFRARPYIRQNPADDTVPLIYPTHFQNGFVAWPKSKSRKPNALLRVKETAHLLVPAAVYVLVKRFSSKEEKRRVVACVYDPTRCSPSAVGFENHLNYFHLNGKGLPIIFAKGLAVYLNSTVVDAVFRQFNGHTQVNASDLKRLPYPTLRQLESLGRLIQVEFPDQSALDEMIRKELF